MSHNRDNEIQGNSFWRRNGCSSKDQQLALSGNAQPNPSSAFSSGWGSRQESSNPQASGGGAAAGH